MKRKRNAIQYGLATLALSTLISVAPMRAQSTGEAPVDRDADLTHQQLAAFDQFLDNHPELAEQLRKDPSLVNNDEFVNSHEDLQRYLQRHPEVREDLNQNPNAVMHQEQRFDRREDRDRDGDRDRDRDRNSDTTRTELTNMDRFMDSHPEISEQLRKDPSLVDNKQFVQDHPALQEFLATHPGVREEMKENPNAFMHREERFDRREDMRELATMDRFMDSHPEIAEQMRKDPSLVNNKEFIANHPALQQFLASHPQVSQEYRDNPNAFMRQEERFDRREDTMRDHDVTRGELSSFHEFLGGHDNISGELSKNPSLATNQEYLENHPALRDYLKANPKVNEELGENPQSFVKSAQQFDMPTKATTKAAPKPLADPKLK